MDVQTPRAKIVITTGRDCESIYYRKRVFEYKIRISNLKCYPSLAVSWVQPATISDYAVWEEYNNFYFWAKLIF